MKCFAPLAVVLSVAVGSASAVEVYQTELAGGGAAHNNMQPSLGVTFGIATQGVYPNGGSTLPGSGPVLGEVVMFGSNFVPRGFLPADGRLLNIAQNTALFSLLGTTYGGNGESTFALPDLRGRTPVQVGTGPGLPTIGHGQQFGKALETLTVDQMPSHNHDVNIPNGSVAQAGGSQAHNNYQPSLGLEFHVNRSGVYPSDGGGGSGTGFLGQVGMYAGAGGLGPGGTHEAVGSLIGIGDESALFSILGTTYGGDGETTFGIPDVRGRAVIGAGNGPGLTNQTLGQVSGQHEVAVQISQMPSHDHDLNGPFAGLTTETKGGDQSHNNMMPTLAMNYIIATSGLFPSPNSPGSPGTLESELESNLSIGEPFLGQISLFAGNFAPGGWEFAHGQLLPIFQNQSLFSLLGTQYGGDGETTFALPDLRGRIPVGLNTSASVDLIPVGLGQELGSETETLSEAQLPRHSHLYVPEPTSLALIGLGSIALIRRRVR